MSAAVVILALAAMVGVSYGYSSGAIMQSPMDAMKSFCTTGNSRPAHGRMPQNNPAPFDLIVPDNVNGYQSGVPVEVTLRAKPGRTFKGFFITGDAGIATGGITGTFSGFNADSKATKFCAVDGMTQTSATPKTEVKVRWTPPQGYHHGLVQFKATVVQDKNTFWSGVLSKPINPPTGVISQEEKMQQDAREFMRKMRAGGMNGMPGMPGMDFNQMMQQMGGMQQGAQNPNTGALLNRFQQQGGR